MKSLMILIWQVEGFLLYQGQLSESDYLKLEHYHLNMDWSIHGLEYWTQQLQEIINVPRISIPNRTIMFFFL